MFMLWLFLILAIPLIYLFIALYVRVFKGANSKDEVKFKFKVLFFSMVEDLFKGFSKLKDKFNLWLWTRKK